MNQQGRASGSSFEGTETILLTEDEEFVRRVVRDVLECYGYRVLEAASGGTAQSICEHHRGPIHLLLTDVIMPEMSGRELAVRLTQVHPEMKVLYMSGYTDRLMVYDDLMSPEIAFIQKPFTPDVLAGKVREVLDAAK